MSKEFDKLPIDTAGEIAFETTIDMPAGALPVRVRRRELDDKGLLLGCSYEPTEPLHSRIIADLAFSDAENWSRFQKARRHNPGVILGTLRFMRLAIFQASRGLSYFFGLYRLSRSTTRPGAAE